MLEGLPKNIVAYILSKLNVSDALTARLVCINVAEAAKECAAIWRHFLEIKGPRKIGPTSKHSQWIVDGKCKLNSEGKCYIASHYKNLEVRYDRDSAFGAYNKAMSIFGQKAVKRAIATKKRQVAHIDRLQTQLMIARTRLDELTEEEESHQRVFKRIKK